MTKVLQSGSEQNDKKDSYIETIWPHGIACVISTSVSTSDTLAAEHYMKPFGMLCTSAMLSMRTTLQGGHGAGRRSAAWSWSAVSAKVT